MIKICIPYRDMPRCLFRMMSVLETAVDITDIDITIIEQTDDGRRFNLGKIINVGFDLYQQESTDKWTYMFHPIDLFAIGGFEYYLSSNKEMNTVGLPALSINTIGEHRFYRAAMFSPNLFTSINGYPNEFWGWGAEDDAFFTRLKIMGIKLPHTCIEFKKWAEFQEDHEHCHASPDCIKGLDHHNENLQKAYATTKESMMSDGLNNLIYKVIETKQIARNLKHIKVEL